MKTCRICKIEKEMSDFSLAKTNKDGRSNKCKSCTNIYVKTYRLKNKDKIKKQKKEYRLKNKEKLSKRDFYVLVNRKECTSCGVVKNINEYHKRIRSVDGYKTTCKLCIKSKSKEYYNNNIDKIKEYRIKNKKINNKRAVDRRKNDIQYRIACNLRTRLHGAIKNNFKSGSAVSDLGCSISDLKIYLEEQFIDNMSWGNWSRTGWHIDHKIPLTSFDLTNREEFLKAVHYTNLQPMWAKDNISKSNN